MYSCGPLHMDEQRQDNQLEPRYSSSVLIQGVNLRTCREQWMIGRGGMRGSEISVLIARRDDDNIKNKWRMYLKAFYSFILLLIYFQLILGLNFLKFFRWWWILYQLKIVSVWEEMFYNYLFVIIHRLDFMSLII